MLRCTQVNVSFRLLLPKPIFMKSILTCLALAFFAQLAIAQSDQKPGKFNNSAIDKYVSSVYDLVKKRQGLAAQLAELEKKIEEAKKKGGSEKELKTLAKKATALDGAYKALGNDAKKIAKNATSATKASSKCGLKATDCLSGVKNASEALAKLTSGIAPELKRLAEAKLKTKVG